MKRFIWILIVAYRYFKPNNSKGYKTVNRFNIISLAVGMMAIVTTLAVLNGLQQGYISTIIEVGSAHLRINSRGYLNKKVIDTIRKEKYVKTILPATESQTLVRGGFGDYLNLTVKGLPFYRINEDPSFVQKLNLIAGSYPANNQIILGEILANNLGVQIGDIIYAVVIAKNRLEAIEKPLVVSGLFKTAFYEYDASRAFTSLDSSLETVALEKEIFYEIKLEKIFLDNKIAKKLARLGLEIESWSSYNRSFFMALKLEKYVMLVLLSLIFLVVALSIYQGRLRDIEQKQNEIAILKALGASQQELQIIFTVQGFLVAFIGSSFGLTLGLISSYNINFILKVIEGIVNLVLMLFSIDSISILSGSSFYLENGIPIKLYTSENMAIFTFAIFSGAFVSYRASLRVARLNVQQILTNG